MNPLQIFEKHPAADAYRVGGFYSPYALVSTEKRFTEAELAAEVWSRKCEVEWWVGPENSVTLGYRRILARIKHRAEVMERFATLPHFDA